MPRHTAVAFFAYHYPPSTAVGALRAVKVAKAFRDNDFDVHVITSSLSDETPSTSEEEGITVHRVVEGISPRKLLLRLKGKAYQPTTVAKRAQDQQWKPPTRSPLWKRFIAAVTWLPDDKQGYILPAVRAFQRIPQHVSLIYSSCPPYSPHLAAALAARRTGAKWIAEFRDPWATNAQKPAHMRTWLTDRWDAALERYCLRRADLVIGVSEGITQDLDRRIPGKPSVLVRNGIDDLVPQHEKTPRRSCRIVHIGTFYYSRDPRPFFRLLKEAIDKLPTLARLVSVELAGQCRTYAGESMETFVNALGIGRQVRFHDWIPHSEAREMISAADVLLLLAQDQPEQVPNKLYEYLGTRKPIIAFADAEGETARMLSAVGGHLLLSNTPSPGETERLIAFLQGPETDGTSGNDVLSSWTTEEQMRRLMLAIENTLDAKGTR